MARACKDEKKVVYYDGWLPASNAYRHRLHLMAAEQGRSLSLPMVVTSVEAGPIRDWLSGLLAYYRAEDDARMLVKETVDSFITYRVYRVIRDGELEFHRPPMKGPMDARLHGDWLSLRRAVEVSWPVFENSHLRMSVYHLRLTAMRHERSGRPWEE